MASISKWHRRDGGVSWHARVRVVGYNALSKTFRTKLEAQQWASLTEAAAKGRTLAVCREATLGALIDEFSPRAKPSTRRLLHYWKLALGQLRLRDVTAALIAKHRDTLIGAPTRSFGQKTLRPRSASTVLHYLCALSTAFRFAIRELHWCEANPVSNVSKPSQSRWRTRFLSDVERDRLLRECQTHRHLYAAVLLSVTTGLRAGELYRMKWSDLDVQALKGLPKNGELVFPCDLTASWRAAMRRAGIEGFRWHDLRHSAASHLAKSGANAMEIATLLGHKNLGMVRRYAHLANSHTRSLVDRVMQEVR
jgi:integrase